MPTTYIGYRPVLTQRDSNNFIGPKGVVGVYSNYELRDTGPKVFTGFPDNNHVLGGLEHARILEYIFAGGHHIAPMRGAGDGPRQEGARFRPWEKRATQGAQVFPTGYGHADRITSYSFYSNFYPDGLDSAEPMADVGHVRRVNAGLSYGGAFEPGINNGVSVTPMAAPGQAAPVDHTSPYGKNKINVWRGVPSSRAL